MRATRVQRKAFGAHRMLCGSWGWSAASSQTVQMLTEKNRRAQESATRQRKKRQGRPRREGGDREVARRLKRESEKDCEER